MREVRRVIMSLMKDRPEWRLLFKKCCLEGSFALRNQAWRFQDEVKHRGHDFELEDMGDALLELARILLPASPAAKWDTEWAAELTSRACRILQEHYVAGVDHSVFEPWAEKIDAAAEAEDRKAYREAVNGYLNAGLEAIEATQRVVA